MNDIKLHINRKEKRIKKCLEAHLSFVYMYFFLIKFKIDIKIVVEFKIVTHLILNFLSLSLSL